jgi:hypothetical protein
MLARTAALLLLAAIALAPAHAQEAEGERTESSDQEASEALAVALELHAAGRYLDADVERLVERGRALVRAGGRAALLRERAVTGGAPRHEQVRAWAQRFAATDDPVEAWALVQRIRFRDHAHHGTIWMHDSEAVRLVGEVAKDDSDPFKRALAADCLEDTAFLRALLLDRDAPALLRAFGAANMGPPEGVTESDARAVLDALDGLLGDDDVHVRALAAVHAARWCVTAADQERYVERVRTDGDTGVRGVLFDGLSAFGTPTALAVLRGIAGDADQPQAVHDLARERLVRLPIRPD